MIDLVHNLSLLVALSILSGFVLRRVGEGYGGRLLQGILFGGAAVISMIDPLHLAPGLHFDSRSVAVSISGLYFGPVAALVSTTMACICRLIQGGVGAHLGIFVTSILGLIGVFCHYWWRPFQGNPGVLRLWAMGMAVHVVMLLFLFALPDNTVWKVLPKLWFGLIVLFPLATILIGTLLADQRISFQASKRLQSEYAQLYATLYGMKDAVIATDHRGKVTLVNRTAEVLSGWRELEARGRPLTEIYSLLDENTRTPTPLSKPDTSTDTSSAEFPDRGILVDREGGEHLVSQTIASIDDDVGSVVVFRDITQRVESERELREVTSRLQGVLDFAPLLIAELDLEGRYLLVNRAHDTLTGQDATGKTLADVLPPGAAARYFHEVGAVAATGVARTVEDTLEFSGGSHSLAFTLFPLYDDDGHVISVGVVAEDVTDRKRDEAEREHLVAQLHQAQKMEAVGRLAGGVAHDFNNMLGVIMGYTEMALMEMAEDDPTRADIEQVQLAAERSADLTKQLLAFARKQVIEPKVLDLNQVVESMLKMLGRLVGEEIELTWAPGAGRLPVHADPTQVDQVLANLVVNARDAVMGHGKLVIVTTQESIGQERAEQIPGAQAGDYIRLSVRDNGCGMDGATLHQIFEPFFTTKPTGQGTGLGLATVYGIAIQNGGFVTAESEKGKGSTFHFYLPQHNVSSDMDTKKQGNAVMQGGSEVILFVEDESALLTLGKLQIERLGYTVLASESAHEALRVAQSHGSPIDLLITDVIMPEMNGRELWQELQILQPGIKTLFMSGYTADVIANHGVLDPGVHFIQKPFSTGKMAARIREVLDADMT